MNIEKMEKNLNVPGAKDDGEKTLAGLLLDFSRALEEVAEVGTFGARKYTRGGWQSVENAEQRYTDAFMRHVLKLQTEKVDPETGFMHWAHAAWNALAVLELYLREEELDLMELVSGRMNEEREGMQLTTGGETFEEVEQGDLRDTTSSTTEQQIEDFFKFLSTVLDLPKEESEAYPAFEFNEEETKIIEGLRDCWVAIDADGEMWSYTRKPFPNLDYWVTFQGDWDSLGYHRERCEDWKNSLLHIKARK